ncbi:MAG: nitrate/nitrite transporter NrtS [Rhodospirillaceae bacterium]|nr:nitrate/nitrite transporter NrtS [Rhodospirillaceae bacterium]
MMTEPTPLQRTFTWPVMRNSLMVGAVVGTILNMINQGEYITGDGTINWFKLGLTYCVPFCVATYGAFTAARIFEKQARAREKMRSRG